MTLTAISSSLQTFFPAADIEKGQDPAEVSATYASIQSTSGLFCPHCYEKLRVLSAVKFRRGSGDRRPHFYHQQDENTQSRCVNYNPESERHIIAKNTIAAQLKVLPSIVSVEVDKIWLKAEYESGKSQKRKPDILATFANGATVAHEIQIARITPEEIIERTRDMIAAGVKVVVWYLFGANFKDMQIRQVLWSEGIQHYHLWFSDDESPAFRFVNEPPGSKQKKGRNSFDDCDRNFSTLSPSSGGMADELLALEEAIARKEEADRDREERRLEAESARAKVIADQALRERIAEIDLQDFGTLEPEQRSLSSLQPAVARSPVTTAKRNLPSQYVGVKVRCKHKPGWVGFVYEQPWGLEGICLDIQWVSAPVNPGTDKPFPLPHNPQRFDVKDLEFSEV